MRTNEETIFACLSPIQASMSPLYIVESDETDERRASNHERTGARRPGKARNSKPLFYRRSGASPRTPQLGTRNPELRWPPNQIDLIRSNSHQIEPKRTPQPNICINVSAPCTTLSPASYLFNPFNLFTSFGSSCH